MHDGDGTSVHVFQAFAVMALLIGATNAAAAAPMTLACQAASGGAPYVIVLDTDNRTISGDGHFAWEPREAISIQITDDEIKWTVPGDSYNTLSRVTGSLLSIGTGTSTGGRWESTCHKSERQF